MTPEELREKAETLRRFARWANDEYTYQYVEICKTQSLTFDLGDFGECSAEVEVDVENSEYQIDPQEIINQSDVLDTDDLSYMADAMEAAANDLEMATPTLNEVLAKMITDGMPHEAALGVAIKAVIDAAEASVQQARLEHQHHAPTNGALPPSPLPWPGALRDDIDYTADDFALRYQPPPGYDWADVYGDRAAPTHAVRSEAVAVVGKSQLLIDNLGRVRYRRNKDDSGVDDAYDSGWRWNLKRCERDGIPAAKEHTSDSRPRAIRKDGSIHTDGTGFSHSFRAFETEAELGQAQRRLAELQTEHDATPAPPSSGSSTAFEPPQPVTV